MFLICCIVFFSVSDFGSDANIVSPEASLWACFCLFWASSYNLFSWPAWYELRPGASQALGRSVWAASPSFFQLWPPRDLEAAPTVRWIGGSGGQREQQPRFDSSRAEWVTVGGRTKLQRHKVNVYCPASKTNKHTHSFANWGLYWFIKMCLIWQRNNAKNFQIKNNSDIIPFICIPKHIPMTTRRFFWVVETGLLIPGQGSK